MNIAVGTQKKFLLQTGAWRVVNNQRLCGLLRMSGSVNNISRLHPPFVRFLSTFRGGRALWRHGAVIETGSTQ